MKSKKTFIKVHQLLNPNKKLFTTLFSISLTMTSLHSAQAEDIEIYENLVNIPVSTIPTENDPNILFVLDTSGSMQQREAVSANSGSIRPVFDSSVSYTQPDGTDSADDNVYVYNADDSFTGVEVSSGVNKCSAATVFFAQSLIDGTDPEFSNRSLAWTQVAGDGQWRSTDTFPAASLGDITALECEDDFGNHGITAGNAEVYPQNQEDTNTSFDPNYTDDVNDVNIVSFQNDASLGFLVPGNYHDYLQSSVDEIITLTGVAVASDNDPEDYCTEGDNASRARDDVFVRDDAGELFQCQTRMGILKRTTEELASTLDDVNIGIFRLNTSEGGSLASSVKPVGEGTNRADFIARLLNLPARNTTPVTETMYEAYAYYAGINMLSEAQGKRVATDLDNTDEIINSEAVTDFIVGTSRVDSAGVTGTGNNLTFVTPIKNECQDNNIILFSDGQPTNDTSYVDEIQTFTGTTGCGGSDGSCLDELTSAMANQTIDVNTTIDGINNVYTYTIGFGSGVAGTDGDFLREAANAGNRPDAATDSQFFVASDSASLTAAFRSIIQSIGDNSSGAFAGAAVAVDTSNRLQNRNELYFALFEATDSPRWNGNVKGYTINSDAEILDSNGDVAIDDTDGSFFADSQSFWSDEIDGADITAGGFDAELDVTESGRERNIFASLVTDTDDVTLFKATDESEAALEVAAIDFVQQVDAAGVLLGAIDADNKLDIARWTFGIDVNDERGAGATAANFFSGDNLHSSPLVISYTDNSADDVLFSMTNQGMLHAIVAEDTEPDGGTELWTYIPDPDLFSNLGAYFNDTVGASKTYGLDSAITIDVDRDLNDDVTKAHLYFGQRRGGSKYFGVDVTNANQAVAIPNGVTPPDATAGEPVEKLWTLTEATATELGQTWAAPVPAVINYCVTAATCAPREVLVISGGYDTRYDGVVTTDPNTLVSTLTGADLSTIVGSGADIKGNAIYIIDPNSVVNGEPEILWQAGLDTEITGNRDFSSPDMLHSFPSEANVIDTDFDGVDDLMFISDIAGQVWRFDFRGHVVVTGTTANGDLQVTFDENDISAVNNNVTGSEEVSGGVIADLSENNANRRFFNTVDVTTTLRQDVDDFARFNIVLGSGYRAHPLIDEGDAVDGGNDGENNNIYIIFDRNLQGPQPVFVSGEPTGAITYDYDNGSQIEGANLLEIGLAGLDSSETGDHRNGFIVELETGSSEKLINPTVTSGGNILAVSYVPAVQGSQLICEPDIGTSRLYEIDLVTGDSASVELPTPGISPGPSIIIVPIVDANGVVTGFSEIVLTGLTGLVADGTSIADGGDGFQGSTSPVGELQKQNWWELQGKN